MYINPLSYRENLRGCWICTSHCSDNRGYPRIRRDGRQQRLSHYVFEQEYGPIPTGMSILHSCDNPLCINPSHLAIGSHRDNMDDMVNKGRGTGKLTLEQQEEVITSLREGVGQSVLARYYGITGQAIHRYKKRYAVS